MQREGHRDPEMQKEPPGRMPDFGDTRGRNICLACNAVVLSVRMCKDDSLREQGAEAECRSFLLTSAELSDKAKLLCRGGGSASDSMVLESYRKDE